MTMRWTRADVLAMREWERRMWGETCRDHQKRQAEAVKEAQRRG